MKTTHLLTLFLFVALSVFVRAQSGNTDHDSIITNRQNAAKEFAAVPSAKEYVRLFSTAPKVVGDEPVKLYLYPDLKNVPPLAEQVPQFMVAAITEDDVAGNEVLREQLKSDPPAGLTLVDDGEHCFTTVFLHGETKWTTPMAAIRTLEFVLIATKARATYKNGTFEVSQFNEAETSLDLATMISDCLAKVGGKAYTAYITKQVKSYNSAPTSWTPTVYNDELKSIFKCTADEEQRWVAHWASLDTQLRAIDANTPDPTAAEKAKQILLKTSLN